MDNENIENIKNAIIAINDSTPPHIKKGFIKALDRLGSALIDIPAAFIERFSEEYRANTETRIKIGKATGENIINNIETSKEYSDYAVKKYSKKILGKQINIDAVSVIAADNINNSSSYTPIDRYEEVTDEWLDEFADIASRKSTDDMRMIFGKILAKEICEPGQVSIRSLHIISQLEKNIAISFQKFCGFCVRHFDNNQISVALAPTFGTGIMHNYSFSKYDFPDYMISKLMEYGLIMSATEFSFDFSYCIDDGSGNFDKDTWFGDRNIVLKKTDSYIEENKVSIHGLFLTDVGINLFSCINVEYDKRILEMMKIRFSDLGLELI